jgi:PAS domain S-box-containing protein
MGDQWAGADLSASLSLSQRILANLPNGSVTVFDRDDRHVPAHGRGLSIEKLDPEGVVGRRIDDVFPADLAALTDPHIRHAFAGDEVVFDLPIGDRTYDMRLAPLEHDRDGVTKIVAVAIDVTAARAAEARLAFLSEAAEALASSLDIEAALAAVARLVVPSLADWCVVHLVGDDGEVERVALTHADPSKEALARELVEGYAFRREAASGTARVLRTGKSELIPSIPDEMLVASAVDARQLALLRSVGLASSLIVPMVFHGRVLGAITLAVASPRTPYDSEALALVEEFARRATVHIQIARLYREARADRDWHERDAAGERQRQTALSRLAASDVIGFVTANAERIVEANDVFLRMVGYDATDLAAGGIDWQAMTPPEHHALDEHSIEELVARGSSTPFEKELLRRDGSRVPVLVGAALLEREPLLGVSFVVDLSARQALEEAHQEFMELIAHDLRNPIAATRWAAQLLQRRREAGLLTDEDLDGGLRTIEDSTTRMAALVNGLIDTAQLRHGESLDLNREAIDLVDLMRHSVQTFQRTSDRHALVITAIDPTLIGQWDQARLERVMDNLLTNAIKYSPEGGDILVTVARDTTDQGDWAVIAVQDHGIGIAEIDLLTVFDPFRRGVNAIARASGSGMGLVGVRQIVEEHRGTISVVSREGTGSTFTVRLPLSLDTAVNHNC